MGVLTLVLFCCWICTTFAGRPLAHTEYGDVYGTEWLSFKERKFHVYMSIPYAEKPIGHLRFEDPKEPMPWSEPIDGSIRTPDCIQNSKPGLVTGQEDCLYINVFTPLLNLRNITQLLPVIVFIHGGAFYFFSGLTFGPRYLLDKDIVLVTFNYRLGIFGFLCTEDKVMPGNAAMKDQVMALTWVQRNIHNFGGDPGSVTLMGMSAGSVSVHYHYFSILSRGLFHRGYMIGGNSFNVWAVQKRPLQKAKTSAKWLGCPTDNSRRIVECLKKKPPSLLAKTTTIFQTVYGPMSTWGPVVDFWSPRPFLNEYPLQSLTRRRHYNVPLIVSDTPNAGLFPAAAIMDDFLLSELDLEWGIHAPYLLDTLSTISVAESTLVLNAIRKYYFGSKPIYQNISRFVEMVGDRYYLADMSKGVSIHAALNPRIRMYMFNYRGRKGIADEWLGPDNKFGAAHIDDFYYIMNRTSLEPTESSMQDVRMIERLTEMVHRYARTGEAVFLPWSDWPAQSGPSNTFTYLRIDGPDSAHTERRLNFANGVFWDSLPLDEPWAGRSINQPRSQRYPYNYYSFKKTDH